MFVQYWDYLRGLVVGDFGTSYQQFRPVTAIIGEQLGRDRRPVAHRDRVRVGAHGRVGDAHRRPRTARRRASARWSMSSAAGLPALLARHHPAAGLRARPALVPGHRRHRHRRAHPARAHPRHPARRLHGQSTRTEFERALEQPFVISARMRGMGDAGVRLRHVLRHAVIPAVTLSGWALGATLSGAVVVESIFSRPGIGSVLVTAVNAQDLPVVVGIVTLVAVFYVLANLLVDIAYTLIDPRLKAS